MIKIQYIGKVRRLVFDKFMFEGDVREVGEKQAAQVAGDVEFRIVGAPPQDVKEVVVPPVQEALPDTTDAVPVEASAAPAKTKRGRKKS